MRTGEGKTLVFGAGDPHADLMLIGEAPGSSKTSWASHSSASLGYC